MVTAERSIKKSAAIMRPERLIWLVALLVVAGVAFYVGRQNGIGVGLTQQQQAAGQFFNERGGGNHGDGSQGGGQGRFGGQGQAGTVTSIDGDKITIQIGNGQTATIQIGANTTIRKQVTGQASDIRAGDRIVAIGPRSGDTIQATMVQIGGFGDQNGQHSQAGQNNP